MSYLTTKEKTILGLSALGAVGFLLFLFCMASGSYLCIKYSVSTFKYPLQFYYVVSSIYS